MVRSRLKGVIKMSAFQSIFVVVGFGVLTVGTTVLARDFRKSSTGRVVAFIASVFFFFAFAYSCIVVFRERTQQGAVEPISIPKEFSNGAKVIRTYHPVPIRERATLNV